MEIFAHFIILIPLIILVILAVIEIMRDTKNKSSARSNEIQKVEEKVDANNDLALMLKNIDKKLSDILLATQTKQNIRAESNNETIKIQNKIIDIDENDCADLALALWNIEKKINNIENNPHKRPLDSYLTKAKKILSRYQIETLDYTNKTYNEGMNVDILATEKNPNATCEIIKETISPTITIDGEIRKRAQIIKEIKGE